jgi:hypothetical protein
MKVRTEITVDVDPTKWADAYGTGTSAREVAADVRGYVRDAVADSAAPLRVIAP